MSLIIGVILLIVSNVVIIDYCGNCRMDYLWRRCRMGKRMDSQQNWDTNYDTAE